MSDTMADTGPRPEELNEETLRRRLINRIALAGIAIVALLGGLAVIDSMYVPPTSTVAKPATSLIPLEAAGQIGSINQSATAAPAPKPDGTKQIAIAPPEPPQPEAVPSIKSNAAVEETSSPPISPPKAVGGKRAAKPLPAQELAQQEPSAAAPAHAATPRPLTQSPLAERRFVLQMGVFNNVDNAQELLAKLQKGGVPAQIEARVQVGPFKSKAEADAARSRLKAMGLDPGLLMAIHR